MYAKRRAAHALGVFVFCACGLLGCESRSDARAGSGPAYGDPVGIKIGAQGGVPALSLAVAVSKGRDPSPSVPGLAGAVHGAAAACPAFVAAIDAGKTVRLSFGARRGALEALGAAPDEVGGACMTAALGGKSVAMDRPESMDVLVELRRDTSS